MHKIIRSGAYTECNTCGQSFGLGVSASTVDCDTYKARCHYSASEVFKYRPVHVWQLGYDSIDCGLCDAYVAIEGGE
jgi:hypothetical protein